MSVNILTVFIINIKISVLITDTIKIFSHMWLLQVKIMITWHFEAQRSTSTHNYQWNII